MPVSLFRRSNLPNPGKLEELKKEAQSVLSPDVFEGARFEFNKTLTQKFALLHNVTLASGAPGTYEFGANFGDEAVLLASRIDLAGRLNGRLNASLTDNWLLRLQAQVQPEGGNTFKADADYKGGDFSAGGYFIGGSNILGFSYLQSLTAGLAVGLEGFYHPFNSKVRGGAGAMRYVWGAGGQNVATAKVGTFGNGMSEIAYQRKVQPTPLARGPRHSAQTITCPGCSLPPALILSHDLMQVSEKVALATEMQYYHNQFCQFGLGYQFNLRSSCFKGLIQSDTTCTAVLEERVQPGINLILSAQLNHKKNDYKFGVGLTIGAA